MLSSRSLFLLAVVGLALLLTLQVAAEDTRLVFVHDANTGNIYKYTGLGSTGEVIYTGISSGVIGAYKGWVYAVQSNTLSSSLTQHRVIRFSQDGSTVEELPIETTTGQIRGISFSDGYLIVNINKKIVQYGLNGLFSTLISSPDAVPYGLSSGDDLHYFTTGEILKVFGADKENGQTRTIYTPSDSTDVLTVATVDDKLIVAEKTKLKKMDDDGDDVEDLTNGKTYTSISAVSNYDDNFFLVADVSAGAVYAVSIEDGTRTLYTSALTQPDGVASDIASDPSFSSSSVVSPSAFVFGMALAFALLLALL